MNPLTEKEMKKLSRTDLLRMLIDQGEEMKVLKEELEKAKAEISERETSKEEADAKFNNRIYSVYNIFMDDRNVRGSLEAALKINGVFEAAQAASQQYLENVKHLSERQDALARIKERETREKCERQILETKEKIVYACLDLEPRHIEQLILLTKLPQDVLLLGLMRLEIMGYIRQPVKNTTAIRS